MAVLSELKHFLWPGELKIPSTSDSGWTVSASNLFPSGRSGLVFSLGRLGLGRSDTVSIPPFSSHCVLSAVSKVATPFPGISDSSSAFLVYEQWGWSFAEAALSGIERFSRRRQLIVDSVDTVFLADALPSSPLTGIGNYRVWSLGKTLGGIGGGLVSRSDGRLMSPIPAPQSEGNISPILLNEIRRSGISAKDFFREHSTLPPKPLIDMANRRAIAAALAEEDLGRRLNSSLLLKKAIVDQWPKWMVRFLDLGGTPAIAPLGLGWSRARIETAQKFVAETFRMESAVYHFNTSGNPLQPQFDLCLAVPMHARIGPKIFETVLDSLL